MLLCGTETGVTVAFVSSSHCCLAFQFWQHFKCTVNKKLLLTFATANKPSSVILLNFDQGLASQPTSRWRLNLLCLSLARSLITISDRTHAILTEGPVILNSRSKQTPVMTSNHTTAAVFRLHLPRIKYSSFPSYRVFIFTGILFF